MVTKESDEEKTSWELVKEGVSMVEPPPLAEPADAYLLVAAKVIQTTPSLTTHLPLMNNEFHGNHTTNGHMRY